MNKRIIIRLVLIMVGAIAILGTLMAITTMPNEKDNGFVRKWEYNKILTPFDTFKIEQDVSAIVGISNHSIFIVGSSPTGVLIINNDTHDRSTLSLSLKVPLEKIVPFYMKIDSPKIFLHLNNAHLLMDGEFPNAPIRTTQLATGVFIKSLQINDSVALIKTPDSTFQNQFLSTVNLNTGFTIKAKILKDSSNNPLALSNDGIFLFDFDNQLIIYLEYFRNKFYCLDTNLDLKYQSHTIDTIASAKLDLAKQSKNDTIEKITPSAARIAINNNATIDQGNLYVVSNLRSDNQTIREFNSHINIDVYNANTGKYINSLQIEKKQGSTAKSILIHNNKLHILFDKELRSYNLVL